MSIFALLLIVGVTYAAFNFTGLGKLVNSISTETVTMVYTEGTNKISLENALPTEDETGMKLTTGDNVFDFTVYIKATNKQAIAYEVTAEKDETSTLGNNDVRIYLEKSLDKTNYEKVSDPSGYVPILENDKFGAKTGEMILDTGTTSREQTYYYRLRMWVSKDYNVASESRSFTITVNVYGVGSNEIDVERILLSDSDVTMKQNESKQLSYEVTPDNASDKRVTWTSSNTDVAVVDSNGNVTGVGEGKAVITATAKDKEKASCNFTITKPDPTGISVVATELNLKTNKTFALNAKVEPSNANTTKLTYTSSDSDIVSVDEEGNLKTGTKTGTATITIKTETGITKKVTVTVTNQQAEGVTIDKTELAMITGSSEQLTATITPDDTIDKTITWTSSNNDVATVDNTGKVTAVAPGTATITATAVGGAKAESTIKVQNPLPTSVTATEKEVNMKSGTTHQLSATVKPDNARSKVLTYTSSNPAVASVSDTGLVTALGAGTTTVTLTTINGLTDTVIVNVTNVKYTVNHNKMNIDGNGYTKAETVTGVGKVGDVITPNVKTYEGFTSPETQSITLTEEDAVVDYNYERNKYTLSVTASKGSSIDGSTASGEYYYDTEITLKGAALDGYTWSKWSDNVTDSTRTFKINKNTSVSTVVTTDTYTITYNLDGGEVSVKNPDTYTVETEEFTLNNPTKTGYTFAGWSTEEDKTPKPTLTISKGTTGNLTYNANWTKDTYTITYNTDGGTLTDETTSYTVTDEPITLKSPAKKGYIFNGWTSDDITTPTKDVIITPSKTSGNKVYTANYTPITYSVKFNANTGTGTMNDESFTYDEAKALTSNSFTKSGYTFASWNTKEDGKGDSYADGSSVSNLSSTDKDTVNLYAIWSRDTYTITYNLDGGTLTGETTTYNVDDADITLPTPTKSGYTFKGWTDEAGNSVTSIPTGSTGPKAFNANWEIITYEISYTLGENATVDPANPTTYTVDTAEFTFNNPTRNGYTFDGWTGSNGTTKQTTVKVPKGTTGKLSYTANWTPIKYTVSYVMNGGTNPASNPTYYNIENGELKITDPTRTGYTFTGWTGTGLSVATKGISIPAKSTGDRTYTANWSINSYTATFNGNGGSNGTSITKPYGEQLGTLPGSSRTGYTFAGWFTSQSGGTQISSGTTIPASNPTYYAQWKESSASETISGKTGTVADDSGNVRYTGANPNNYVRFNNELWRIVGSFANISNGTTSSKRIKLVKNGYAYTGTAFDSNNSNDYSTSTLKTTLNGTYYNGLTTDAKNMIEDVVWNTGGFPQIGMHQLQHAANFYSAERSSTVYSGHATTWTGKVGLMYPSDYGICNSQDQQLSRATCLGLKQIVVTGNWYASGGGPCAQNDYLFDSSHWQWTITPYSGNSGYVFYVNGDGYVGYNYAYNTDSNGGVRPAVFLKSSISISGGSGTASDPYTLTG